MRPDGQGTDERVTPTSRWRRARSGNSLERDMILLAVAFAVLALLGWGAVYLSKRATQPSEDTDTTSQQPP
ncbi:MAG: hypothetical protein M3347_11075 [Armatimonadota bacterium]|nr:hypothetical protein [Armatimonadota bacterium]